MNDWPPKPGLTVMTKRRSMSSRTCSMAVTDCQLAPFFAVPTACVGLSSFVTVTIHFVPTVNPSGPSNWN